jgi:hypothetical protein
MGHSASIEKREGTIGKLSGFLGNSSPTKASSGSPKAKSKSNNNENVAANAASTGKSSSQSPDKDANRGAANLTVNLPMPPSGDDDMVHSFDQDESGSSPSSPEKENNANFLFKKRILPPQPQAWQTSSPGGRNSNANGNKYNVGIQGGLTSIRDENDQFNRA